jgi:hypothetical protein
MRVAYLLRKYFSFLSEEGVRSVIALMAFIALEEPAKNSATD